MMMMMEVMRCWILGVMRGLWHTCCLHQVRQESQKGLFYPTQISLKLQRPPASLMTLNKAMKFWHIYLWLGLVILYFLLVKQCGVVFA